MKHSPLQDQHGAREAKMADFGGWLMPIDYPKTGTIAEHTAVRERVGIFDVSHLGKVSVKGRGALKLLNRAFTNDLNRIGDGQAQYTMMCSDQGGVIDDLIVYRNSAEDFLLVPNAANTSEVVAALQTLQALAPTNIEVRNLHDQFGVIAIQGPDSPAVLEKLGVKQVLDYMSFERVSLAGSEVVLCRTGYTGEMGFEILPKWNETEKVWIAIVDAMQSFGGVICGLGARDTLRTEMGYPLHGHELSLQITPVQASANWAIGWDKDEFVGHEALRRERADGAPRKLRGIKMIGRGIPRAHMQVQNSADEAIGEITSGTFSPTLKRGIALGLLSPTVSVGDLVKIDIRGNLCDAEIVKVPFVPSHVR